MNRQYKPSDGTGAGTPNARSPAGSEVGPDSTTLTAALHAPAPARVAERERAPLNAVIKVIALDAHGGVLRTWGAKATWEGPLPQHFHGDHRSGTWRWDDAASARSVRVHTQADGTGGESVESWAARLHAARVEIFAEPIEAVSERAARDDVDDPSAPGDADDVRNAPGRAGGEAPHPGGSTERVPPGEHGPGVDSHARKQILSLFGRSSEATGAKPSDPAGHAEHRSGATSGDAGPDERITDVIAFEHELGIDLAQDEDAGDDDGDTSTKPHGQSGSGGAGYEGGDPAGRTGKDTSTTGQGPGGDTAKADGYDEGSTSAAPDGQGTKTGDRDGERHGSANGRYEGKDATVTRASAVPERSSAA